jgi:hypothetical protein
MTFNGITNQHASFYLTGVDTEPGLMNYRDIWLKVFVDVTGFMRSWTAEDVCLTMHEVQQWIRWLEDLATPGKEAAACLYFTEPNLSFRHLNTRKTGKTIRIDFDLELKPYDAEEGERYFATFRLTDAELLELAEDLSFELECVLGMKSRRMEEWEPEAMPDSSNDMQPSNANTILTPEIKALFDHYYAEVEKVAPFRPVPGWPSIMEMEERSEACRKLGEELEEALKEIRDREIAKREAQTKALSAKKF